MLTCGSLFSGAGLLDIGLHLAGFEHLWMCESDPWRRKLLRTRFGVPVHDDIRTLRGQAATDTARNAEGGAGAQAGTKRERIGLCAGTVDLIAGGFPCKGASSAGNGTGLEHAETALWSEMRRVVGELRPRYVLIENVANILGMAAAPGEPAGSLWGTVLGDLAALGFDVRWDCLPAAAIGAPHLRDRVFAVATNTARIGTGESTDAAHAVAGGGDAWAEPTRRNGVTATDADGAHDKGHGRSERVRAQVAGADGIHDCTAPADTSRDGEGGPGPSSGTNGKRARSRADDTTGVDWGEYEPAIRRWEAVHGAAPEPLVCRVDDGDPKLLRVRARVDRSRLSALGDGVHVYCGWLVGLAIMRHAETGGWG